MRLTKWPGAILPVLLAGALQGCDLSTPAPTGVVLPGDLDGKDGLPTLLAGAVGDFAVAYGGNDTDDGFVLLSGLLADELRQTIGSSPNVNLDRRVGGTSNLLTETVYRDLQRARASAEETVRAYRAFDPSAVGVLYARNLAGFAYLVLAEGFCGGIPFSRANVDGAITYGAAETTTQVLARALSAFDSVLSAAPDGPGEPQDSLGRQIALARVGRARALLDLGRTADAGAEAGRVPDDFVWKLEYSSNSSREVNGVNYHAWGGLEYSAADSEGVNGIGFLSADDPRAEVDSVATNAVPVEYATAASPIVLASTTEARLIEAESLLERGDAAGALALLNALRASVALAPLSPSGSPAERLTQLFRERAFWLWLTGHRLGDLRRLVRQYHRPADTVYPIGRYAGGSLEYGDQVSLSVSEVNNPRFDPSACDPAAP
jgi:hypothetical protein